MSIAFNGSSTKLTFSGNVRGAYPITMFGWVKPNSASVSQMAFGVADFGGDDELMGYLDGGGNGKAKAFARRSGGSSTADSASSISTAWQPFMVVFLTTGSRTCYYGAGAAGTNTSSIDAILSTHDRFVIGCRGKDDTLWFNGEIAEVGIWSTALGSTEWDALKAGALPETVAAASLVEHWPLLDAADLDGLVSRTLTASNATTGASHPISRDAGDPPLGTVIISDVDPGETSAVVTYSYDDTDQTGFEYRLDGGTAASLGASPATISGLTASTEYDLEVRAINDHGAGSWSAVETFTTDAVVLPTVTVTDPLKNNTGTLLASQSGIVASVLAAPTLAFVHTLSGLTTNGSGLLAPISHASLTTGQQYHVAIKLADGSVGITGPITAS